LQQAVVRYVEGWAFWEEKRLHVPEESGGILEYGSRKLPGERRGRVSELGRSAMMPSHRGKPRNQEFPQVCRVGAG
jgi:hypothetical protein